MKKNYSGFHKPNSKKYQVSRENSISDWKNIMYGVYKHGTINPYGNKYLEKVNQALMELSKDTTREQKYTWNTDPNPAHKTAYITQGSTPVADGTRPTSNFDDEPSPYPNPAPKPLVEPNINTESK